MLLSADVPPTLWDEALKTANFIRNRLPNKTAASSPYEVVTRRRPSLSHLCEFGKQVHVVIDDHYLRKFAPRTEEGFVVGFTMRSTYHVFLKASNRVTESCNIIFKPHKIRATPKPQETVTQLSQPIPAHQPSPLDQYQPIPAHQPSPLDQYFPDLKAQGFSFSPECGANYETASEDSSEIGSTGQGEIPSPDYSQLTDHGMESSHSSDETQLAMLVATKGCIVEPITYKEAIESPDKDSWLKAIQDEFEAHKRNGTWIIVDRPTRKLMSTKWVFKVKTTTDGSIERFKARLVARGFEQRAGFDYGETFAPVAGYETIRTLIALAAQNRYIIKQFDVTTAFFYGTLEEEVFISPPEGMELGPDKALKLVKGLYGLKQAPRVWNAEFNKQVAALGFKATKSDYCLFQHETKKLYLCIYVDDGLMLYNLVM